jgi:nitroreductase
MIASPTTSLSVIDAAAKRRSIRAFVQEPVPREDLEQIIEVASLAPSAFNAQPWRFVVVEDAELKAKLAGVAFNQRQVHSAPAVIVLYTDIADTLANVHDIVHPGLGAEQHEQTVKSIVGFLNSKDSADAEAWGAGQGNIALGYLLLAAEGLGYQTSAMAGFDPEGVKKLLGLPANVRVNALVAVGKGAEEGFPHHRHPVSRLVKFV